MSTPQDDITKMQHDASAAAELAAQSIDSPEFAALVAAVGAGAAPLRQLVDYINEWSYTRQDLAVADTVKELTELADVGVRLINGMRASIKASSQAIDLLEFYFSAPAEAKDACVLHAMRVIRKGAKAEADALPEDGSKT